MMWVLLCTVIFFCAQHLFATPFLVPADEKCDNVKCPELNCTTVRKQEGECCNICITAEGCLHDGEHYDELSIVPLNQSHPCKPCFCSNGKITCENITGSCPQIKCNISQQIEEPEKCCPRCLNENQVSTTQATCEENGIVYQEDDTWNPFYVNFGTVESLQCTCKNGTKLCNIILEEECNGTLDDKNETVNCSIPHTTPTIDLNPDIPPESNTTCSPAYSHKVYESVNKIQEDEVAIENVTSSRVYVIVWSAQLPSAYIESYSTNNFVSQFNNTRFTFIGNTTDKSVETVYDWLQIKNMNQSLFYCKVNCSTKVINLLLQPCN